MVTEARQTTLDEIIQTTEPLVEVTGGLGASKEKHFKDTWGEVIFYSDGWAWGISPAGATICLGREQSVKESISGDTAKLCGDPIKDAIIELERKIKGDIENGKRTSGENFRAIRVSNKRNRPASRFEHRTKNIKRTPAGKRFPGGKTKRAE